MCLDGRRPYIAMGMSGRFDFEDRPRLALPEEERAEGFLKTDVPIVELIVYRG